MELRRIWRWRLLAVLTLLCGVATAQEFVYVDSFPHVLLAPVEYGRLTWGDVNGDGAVDNVTGSGVYGNAAKVHLNDGHGRFHAPVELPMPPAWHGTYWGVQQPALIDLDLDGDLDVVTQVENSRGLPNHAVAWLNDGRGNFTLDSNPRFARATELVHVRVEVLDANVDGAPDLMFVARDPYRFWLWLNDGSGNFVDAPAAFPPMPMIGDIAVEDLDRDGDPDILFGHYSGLSFVLDNDGTGQFRQGFTFSSLMACYAARTVDIDRDGDADVLFGREPSPPGIEIWLNDGSGNFTLDTQAFQSPWPTGYHRSWIDVLDFDGDGDLDLFPRLELWLNDGSGRFTESTARLRALGIDAQMAVDLDRDGDADLLRVANLLRRGVWWVSTARQIHISQDPPVGGTLQLDVYAPPSRLVTYLLGLARQDLRLPGIGWSALDPALSVAWPLPASVPQSRMVSFTLPVPNQPSLRGLTLLAQSIDFGPGPVPRLANFTTCTIR